MRDIDCYAACERCGAEFSWTYDNCRVTTKTVCLGCLRVDDEKRCDCRAIARRWRFDDCPLCRGPLEVEERLSHAY